MRTIGKGKSNLFWGKPSEVFKIISNLYFLQFCFKTEGFLSHYFVEKTFSFSLKTEGITNFSLNLKLKVFQRKPSVFFYKKLKQN